MRKATSEEKRGRVWGGRGERVPSPRLEPSLTPAVLTTASMVLVVAVRVRYGSETAEGAARRMEKSEKHKRDQRVLARERNLKQEKRKHKGDDDVFPALPTPQVETNWTPTG